MPVMRLRFNRDSTDVEWPWEGTGDPGSAKEQWNNDVRARVADARSVFTDTYNCTLGETVIVSDLEKYFDVTFPDQATMDAYADYVNTDPDWMPAVPSMFGLSKTVEIDPA